MRLGENDHRVTGQPRLAAVDSNAEVGTTFGNGIDSDLAQMQSSMELGSSAMSQKNHPCGGSHAVRAVAAGDEDDTVAGTAGTRGDIDEERRQAGSDFFEQS